MNKLKRSHDRKVTNLVNAKGNGSLIQNTFGLPAGKNYSCPGATSICEKVCYAGKLEKLYKAVKANLLHNWELLKDNNYTGMYLLLDDMIKDFIKDCDKRNAEKLFRIHWDGDFFNDEYTKAWYSVIQDNHVDNAKVLSVDHGIKLAYLADTFAMGKEQLLNLVNAKGVPCPENNKKIPLIDKGGSACVKCSQCVVGRNNILFSASKK